MPATYGTGRAAVRMLWRASRPLTAGAVALLVADAVLPSLTLVTMGRATGHIPGAVTGGLSSAAGHALLWTLALAAGCFALSMLRGPVQDVVSAAARARLTAQLQSRLVRAVSAPPGIAHLEDPAVLDRLASAQGEVMGQQPADAPATLMQQIGARLGGLAACGVLSTYRWWLGLLLLAAWLIVRRPLSALVRSRVGTYRKAGEPQRRYWYFLGISWRPAFAKEVRVFGLGDWVVEESARLFADAMRPTWRTVTRLNVQVAAVALLVLAAYGLGAGTLAWGAYHGTVGLRTLATMLPMLLATMPVGSVTVTDFSLAAMLASLPDLEGLEADLAPAAVAAGAGTAPAEGLPREVIRLEGLGFRYPGGEHEVLRDVDLELPAGRSLALVGINGAGKTTLVTLLARLREPTAGRITVDGTDLADLDPAAWQRQLAVVFQDFTRYPLTAAENVSLALRDDPPDPDALRAAADRAGAADLVEGLEHGWETVLSPHYSGGTDLSGGQWQRLALARALYAVERGAKVLILDEPTAQLDVRAESAFYDRFLQITEGTTSVVISHRFSTVRRADRIAVLDGGRITETGSHDELLAAGGQYAELFRAQASRFVSTTAAKPAGDR
jgi:ATP-binding cassette, subfamily B, bacterial